MSDQSSEFGAFLAGFIIGGLVGAATALMLAPQSGEETRTLIRDRSIELRDRAATTAEEARQKAEIALEDARRRAEVALEEARVKADELAVLTRERTHELQERGHVVLEEQKSKLRKVIKTEDAAPGDGEVPTV